MPSCWPRITGAVFSVAAVVAASQPPAYLAAPDTVFSYRQSTPCCADTDTG